MKARYASRNTPAPIVPDVLLERLGEAFLQRGGRLVMGEDFEAFVRRYAGGDPVAHARARQRACIDRRAVQAAAMVMGG